MRLIDADKLIEDGWHLVKSGRSNRTLGVMSIADVPTAYDLDKVVEQLEREVEWVKVNCGGFYVRTGATLELLKAIEIVKGGAV